MPADSATVRPALVINEDFPDSDVFRVGTTLVRLRDQRAARPGAGCLRARGAIDAATFVAGDARYLLCKNDGNAVGHDTWLQQVPGIGPVLAAVLVAEIGDVGRFPVPELLACLAGLTPKHHESDTHVHRGRITKQGSRLVRWAVVESVQILPTTREALLYRCSPRSQT